MSVQPHAQPQAADVVLHAEQVQVSTRQVPVERVRFRREIITEDVTVTVTVRREVLRIEREPLTTSGVAVEQTALADSVGPAHAAAGAGTGPEVLEIILSTERPVIYPEVVPYERVLLGVRSVATATPVTVDVHHEVADVETEVTSDIRS